MESHYWWSKSGLEALENGKFHFKNPEIEAKLGNGLVFDYEPWMGPNFAIRGKSNIYHVDVFQHPRNCGQLIAGFITSGEEQAKVQDFIIRNFMALNGYGTCGMSITKGTGGDKVWEKLGWTKVFEALSSRNGSTMQYFMMNIPKDDMVYKDHYGGDDTFIPAQYKDKVTGPFWAKPPVHGAGSYGKVYYNQVVKPEAKPAPATKVK